MLAFSQLPRRLSVCAFFGAFLCLLLAGCGGSSSTGGESATATATATTAQAPTATKGTSSGPAIIAMGSFSFTGNTSVTIKAGQTVKFDDTSGGSHILVIGTHGQFKAQTGAPAQLNNSSGITFNVGDAKTVTFPNAGTFQITCMIHPSMQATVTVTK